MQRRLIMNEQMPFGFFPGNPGSNFQNQSNCQCSRELRNINNRISNIEQQINRLERRIRRLEFNNRVDLPCPDGPNNKKIFLSLINSFFLKNFLACFIFSFKIVNSCLVYKKFS